MTTMTMTPSTALQTAAKPAGTDYLPQMLHDLAARLMAMKSAFSRWWTVHRAETELAALDDRLLADIGLVRADIPEVLRRGS